MTTRDEDRSGLLMLSAVTATCHDCDDETILVPAEGGDAGEFCCTSCDAAVWLVVAPPKAADRAPRRRVA
jgi:hypothetical protein